MVITNVLKNCLDLKSGEKCLIITDVLMKDVAKDFYKNALKISEVKMIEIPVLEIDGEEPSIEIDKDYDVALFITSKSISHTDFRRRLISKGVRIASMPRISKDMIKRSLDVDYNKIKDLNEKLRDILVKTSNIEIKTKLGTNLKMNIKGREIFLDSGLYREKGQWGNLPAGEVCLAPLEETTNGILYVDKSIGGVGKLKGVLKIKIQNGFLIEVEGKDSQKFLSNFKDLDENAFMVAEFGIGTNYKAKITGNILEDEKVLGTAHIAFGNNISFGGNNDVPIHLDAVFSKPVIKFDDRIIDIGAVAKS